MCKAHLFRQLYQFTLATPSYEIVSVLGLYLIVDVIKIFFASLIGKRLAFNYFFSYILMTKYLILHIFQNVFQWQ